MEETMRFNEVDWDEARLMFFVDEFDTKDIAETFGVHESTVYNNLNKIKAAPNSMARAS